MNSILKASQKKSQTKYYTQQFSKYFKSNEKMNHFLRNYVVWNMDRVGRRKKEKGKTVYWNLGHRFLSLDLGERRKMSTLYSHLRSCYLSFNEFSCNRNNIYGDHSKKCLMFPKDKTLPFRGDPICPSPSRGMAISFRPGLVSSLWCFKRQFIFSSLQEYWSKKLGLFLFLFIHTNATSKNVQTNRYFWI